MPGVSNTVFLSYASEDREAVERIARALGEAGIEVWFDKDALRGGDAWDRRIRRQIRECALFDCLALAYHTLGDPVKARAELQKYQEVERDSDALEYAEVYAQWGDTEHALEWVERSERLHDPALQALKVLPTLDPIRNEPRFKAVEKRLNFPP